MKTALLVQSRRWLALPFVFVAIALSLVGNRPARLKPPASLSRPAAMNLAAAAVVDRSAPSRVALSSRAARSPEPLVAAAAVSLPRNVQMHRFADEAPAWAVGFGKEFWRRPAPDAVPVTPTEDGASAPLPATLNLGDLIERVDHAIAADTNAPLPQTRARAYTAAFDGAGLRFSPHRPAEGAGARLSSAAAGSSEEGVPDNGNAPEGSSPLRVGTPAPQPDPATEVRFRTVSIRRDGATLFDSLNSQPSTLNPSWSLLGNTAQHLPLPPEPPSGRDELPPLSLTIERPKP